ncbi:thiamine pyrophosphate-binding protein [Wenzhouxiangella sp. XN24]|uniref:thiamine pyrophosphate-binding protein n=1 Tax=Wenzhouxiangella sp. XN24 TaxID=2713569 RepID=UPI0013EB4F64|nr:thiamine pyrophosphate-binding protein [Wenzhouxiangella sp. XN24]NGX14906.1 thiamine pyrophosphate-binding protein [Wenzhouxiangella sp. XN24]
MNGGARIARVLHDRGVREIFTLCGGHISPILVEAKRIGIRITDVRDEATAVFAADAHARLTGIPGVAAVTAGPGLTNTITPLKNAQLAQSPVLVLGGATATALKNRGALQDIDQMPLMKPHVKYARAVKRLRDLAPAIVEALEAADTGVPGPVFVECPVDLLYDEEIIRGWYADSMPRGDSLADKAVRFYLERHTKRLFAGGRKMPKPASESPAVLPRPQSIRDIARQLAAARRPVMVCGSQAVARAADADLLRDAIIKLGIPVYLSGMSRGLLGAEHPLLFRHRRRDAIKGADLVILAGVPCDFRLDYGKQIRRSARLVSFNLSRRELRLNRKPDDALLADPGLCVRDLADAMSGSPPDRSEWLEELAARDAAREADIDARAAVGGAGVNPLRLCREIDKILPDDSVLVADGGDFVGTASYVVRPRGPLRWLDPGAFGTLGVGGGFAIGAARARPSAEVWILYGDGSLGYSLIEFDSYVRHGLAPIAIIGNDACWAQIAREQVKMLGDDVGVRLARTDYHRAAEGLGAAGLVISSDDEIAPTLAKARELSAAGQPVLVNVHLAETDFREGSLSI